MAIWWHFPRHDPEKSKNCTVDHLLSLKTPKIGHQTLYKSRKSESKTSRCLSAAKESKIGLARNFAECKVTVVVVYHMFVNNQ